MSESRRTLRLLSVYGIFAAVMVLYWPAMVALGELWLDGARTTYTHGFLIAATSLWLVWRGRADINRVDAVGLTPTHRLLATVALLAVALGWQIAYRAGLQLVVEVLLLPLFWLPVLLLLGWNAARATLMPVGLLVFTLPLWDLLTPVLQFGSAQAARLLLRLVGVPAYFHGNSVEIPGGVFVIEGGCSGLHYFITALAIATLLGELREDHWRRRVWWLVVAGGLAVVVNWIRVSSIIFVGHVSQMQNYLVRESHYGYGWTLFALALVLLFVIERRTPHTPLARRESTPDTSPSALARVSPASYVSCGLIVMLPMLINGVVNQRLEPGASMAPLTVDRAGWREAEPVASEWHPIQNNADVERRRRFVRDGFAIESYVAEYREQRLGKKLGGYANRPQGDAEVIEAGTLADPRLVYMVIEKRGQRSLLVLTYRVANRGFASATHAQLWYSWLTLRSMFSPRSAVLTWYAPCNPDCAGARSLLVQFLEEEADRS